MKVRCISVGHGSAFDFDLRHGNSIRSELRAKLRRLGVKVGASASLRELQRIERRVLGCSVRRVVV